MYRNHYILYIHYISLQKFEGATEEFKGGLGSQHPLISNPDNDTIVNIYKTHRWLWLGVSSKRKINRYDYCKNFHRYRFFRIQFFNWIFVKFINFQFFSYFEVKMLQFIGHIPISDPAYFVSPLSILSVMAVYFIIFCLDKWQTARKHKAVAE